MEENKMRVIADIMIVPIGVGVSVSKYIAECQKVFDGAGLNPQMHGYGTNIEGEWEEIFGAIKKAHEVLHKMGVPRISSDLRFGTRTDKMQTIQDKINSVKEKLHGKDIV